MFKFVATMTTFSLRNNIPELNLLLTKVEHLFGKRVSTPYDFEALSNYTVSVE